MDSCVCHDQQSFDCKSWLTGAVLAFGLDSFFLVCASNSSAGSVLSQLLYAAEKSIENT